MSANPAIRLAIIGARGRMGRMLSELAPSEGLEVVAEADQGDELGAAIQKADVTIDFSFHEVTPAVARNAAAAGKALVIGTTGHTDAELQDIRACAASIPMVFAPNYSVGVNTMFWLTKKCAEILGPGFDLEVAEIHHGLKRDAPSGTAKRLAELLCEVRELQYQNDVKHGRHGITGERSRTEIGMHALRGGDVVGEHTVYYAAAGERIEITHRATSRATFARGALRAAVWAIRQKAGLYDMQDVLGLR